jgi:hypothetical protein
MRFLACRYRRQRLYNVEPKRRSLPGDDCRPSQEEHPNAIPAVSVGLDDLGFVRNPVLVPAPDGGRIVNTENIDILDLETVAFQL